MSLVLRPPGSRESLADQLAALGRTRKAVALAGGLFQFGAAVLGGAAIAGAVDAGFHLPPLARAFALASILSLGGILWLRGVSRALALRTEALPIALELEDQYPALNDALASAVSFLGGPGAEARGVSYRLEAAAVRSAHRLADRLEFNRLVPSGACWRAVWAFVIISAAIVPFVLVDSGRAATALVRLADPFGAHPWPTKTRVEILEPSLFPFRIPRGEPFELSFVVRGVIKDHAAVTFRMAGDEFEEHFPLAAGNDPRHPGAAVVTARFDANRLSGPFQFRVSSNDHSTDWRDVNVVSPPRLVPLDGRPTPQFRFLPPAYTGLPGGEWPDGTVLELPVGSLIWMRAATDVRLAHASLVFLGERTALEPGAAVASVGHLNPLAAVAAHSLADSIGSDIPLALDPEGRVMTAGFMPSMTGMYALKMTDETGLTGSRLVEIRLTPDPAPIVTLLHPAAGRDPMILTPSSSVLVHVVADDKLYAVRNSYVEYRVGRSGPIRTIRLEPRAGIGQALSAIGGGLLTAVQAGTTSTEARRLVPVTEFTQDDGSPVCEGDVILLRGAADDWDDVTPAKEPGRSEGAVEIRISSVEAIEALLQRELAHMRPELVRLRDHQRDARQQTSDAVPLPDGSLALASRDGLLAAEHAQRQIRGRIGDPRDGLRARAETLRATARANDLPRSTITERVERVASELTRLADRDLQAIEPGLAEARQAGLLPAPPGQEQHLPELIRRAVRHQKAVEDGLTGLLDLLSIWGGASEIRGEARVLRDHLNRLAGETEHLAESIPPGLPVQDLGGNQRVELDRAGVKSELASERASSLLTNAARLASARESTVAGSLGAAAAQDALAGALAAAADALPPGDPARSTLAAQAHLHGAEAEEQRSTAARSLAEAAALRKGIRDAGGQTLPDEIRKAAEAVRRNRQTDGSTLLRSAAGRLDRLAEALAERAAEAAPDLKKWKAGADELNALADAQDDLRKRTAEAAKIADPVRREAELKRLAREQDQLIDQGKIVLQRLTRDRAEDAARQTRDALNRMESARDQLEAGSTGLREQNDAVARLDSARDRLDTATARPAEQLSDEQRRKTAALIAALVERQKAAVAEAGRIHKLVENRKAWERPLLQSYKGLEDVERELSLELRALAEKQFEPLPVLARLLTESARAAELAADKMQVRREDALDADPAAAYSPELESANDRKVNRPMALALRRLEQLLDALKPDEPKKHTPDGGGAKGPGNAQGPKTTQPMQSGAGDLVPPLAQLKVLRALQAELNVLTAEFAKNFPDPDKLTDEQRDELKELEQAQRDIAALFEKMAELFKGAQKAAGPENKS